MTLETLVYIISATISGHPKPGTGPKYSGTEMSDASTVNACKPDLSVSSNDTSICINLQPASPAVNKLQIRPTRAGFLCGIALFVLFSD